MTGAAVVHLDPVGLACACLAGAVLAFVAGFYAGASGARR